jgi:hypothetical protein
MLHNAIFRFAIDKILGCKVFAAAPNKVSFSC